MRRVVPSLLLVTMLMSAGCSDEQLRDTGRKIEQALGQRWEAWLNDVNKDIEAKAERQKQDRNKAREQARAQARARAERQAEKEKPAPAKAKALSPAALAEIVKIAERQRAQSLTVKQNGKTVLARRWGRQDDLHAMMQMTTPIVILTMSQLVEEGKIPSLDTPLGHWLPAFREGKKSAITLRHVLTGRDGLKTPDFPAGLYREPDYIGFFTRTTMRSDPGPGQFMPGPSLVLLGEVVEAAAGMPLDRWVATRLLEPLGIKQSRWRKDKAGNLDAWAGLWLPPSGALKIGELVLNEGRWNGRQVLPRAWVIEVTSPSGYMLPGGWQDEHGYGWRTGVRVLFRKQDVARLRREGYAHADQLEAVVGRSFRHHRELQQAIFDIVGEAGFAPLRERARRYDDWLPNRRFADRAYGFQTSDYIGNQLIVNPTKQIVALHTVPWDGRPVTRSIADFEFDDLADRLDAASE